jgi:murein DD-endopeptidase MepM/ murein hydrolase activator NlpD
VWSVGDGRVSRAGYNSGFGRVVEVSHPNGWVSQYAHLSKINVHMGQHVRQKQTVGLVGMTGLATGPHLHYGLRKNGHYVNSLAQHFERATALSGPALAAFRDEAQRLAGALSKIRIAQGRTSSAGGATSEDAG